ncbi:MAG: iron uptake porin, partial [Cyanobacteriota bacterium]|nr:iron uptake porin [Cyanobacteriota bacterium]
WTLCDRAATLARDEVRPEFPESTLQIQSDRVPAASQFSDVNPTNWAFEALQSLAERYDCLAGYPDDTYRGTRPLTRFEFAAALNACWQKLETAIAANAVSSDDLEQLDRLRRDFAVELEGLRDRIDDLDSRLDDLESRQFSPTTTLNGLAFLNLTRASAAGDVRVETANINAPLEIRPAARHSTTHQPLVQLAEDPETIFSNLVWLTLNTSFTGQDNLVLQLAAGNGNSPANAYASAGLYNTFGVPYTDQTSGTNVGINEVVVRELFYQFPIGDRVQITVGPRINWYRHFDNNAYTFFLTGASSFNAIGTTATNAIDRGAGAVVAWDINDTFHLTVGYLGENNEFLPSQFGFNTASNPAKGLFSATHTASAELAVSPADPLEFRLFYNYARLDNNVPIFDESGNLTGFGVGGATGEPITGVADDGFGGSIEDSATHAFGVNFDLAIAPWMGAFGRYSYAIAQINPITSGRSDGQIRAQSLQFGLAFPDLGKKGALATISYLIPFSLLDGRNFLASGGGNGGVQYEVEATYFYPLTHNIALVPAFYWIGNPNNFSNNSDIYIGNFRVQFSF